MNKYPKVNYIGNKEKIVHWIIDNLPIKNGKILDLFAGGCSVSYGFKKMGFEVLSNDVLYSNFCISKAIIENNSNILELKITSDNLFSFFKYERYENIKWLENNLYFKNEVKELSCLLNYADTLKEYDKFIFLAILRRAMVRKIPYSRMCVKWEEIVKLRDEELSYQKYGRRRAYHNISFLEHVYLNLSQYNNAIFNNGLKNLSYNLDCFKMIDQVDRVDLIYIDPPYPSTMNNYFDFYGSFDIMLNKTNTQYTDFTNKNTFLQNLNEIFKRCKNKTHLIVISLNTKSNPTYQEIIKNVDNFIDNVSIKQMKHIYKVTGKREKEKTEEILMIFKLK